MPRGWWRGLKGSRVEAVGVPRQRAHWPARARIQADPVEGARHRPGVDVPWQAERRCAVLHSGAALEAETIAVVAMVDSLCLYSYFFVNASFVN